MEATTKNPPAGIPRADMTGEQLRAAYDATTDSITLTKEGLHAALMRWEQDRREGKCLPHEEADAMPIEQRVQESADYLWGVITAKP